MRHWLKARQARSGWPRWNVEDKRPPTARAKAMAKKMNPVMPVGGVGSMPSQKSSPKPRPERVEKMITDGAGCIRRTLREFCPAFCRAS
ncbi:hypothetical protein [Shimia sp. SK013]|uniref:hypothetical protein n=1 Tax=Shimia sp. SK013 TaxID=1389006 RepID=UPI00406C08AA